MNGIIVINKPKNYTSFDVVAIIKKLLNEKKVGHAGTLDPMATGVLPILIGRATKLQNFLPDNNKEYIAKIKFGLTTDTLDITGKIVSSNNSYVTKKELEKILINFRGKIKQTPPMFSAVKKNGIRLYKLARNGIKIERNDREILINKLTLLDFDKNLQIGTLLINCSKGTYIRSLCDDIGKKLKCGAVLTDLIRTKTCSFDIKNSITLDEVKALALTNKLTEQILPCDIALKNFNNILISLPQVNRFTNGGSLSLDRISSKVKLKDKEIVKVYNANIGFIGLGKVNFEKNDLDVACLIKIKKDNYKEWDL